MTNIPTSWAVKRLSGALGAEIRGPDISNVTDADIDALKALLHEPERNLVKVYCYCKMQGRSSVAVDAVGVQHWAGGAQIQLLPGVKMARNNFTFMCVVFTLP